MLSGLGRLEAEGGIGCSSSCARWSGNSFANPAETERPAAHMDPLGTKLFEYCNIFCPPLLKESFSISRAEVTQLPTGGYASRRWRSGRREYGQHRDRARASEVGEHSTSRKHRVVEMGRYDHRCRTSILDLLQPIESTGRASCSHPPSPL